MRYGESQVQCYDCKKYGHYASENRAPSTKINKKVNYVEEKNDEDGTFLLERNDTSEGQENTWHFNTSASNHMSKNKSIFVEINEFVNGNVTVRDDSKYQ